MAGCECWGHGWAVKRPRCPLGKTPFGAENQNQIGWEPRAGKPCRRNGCPEKRRLQTVNTAHVGIKESLLKFGQKAEGSGREATSMGCQIKDALSSEFVYLELIMMMTTMITANIESMPVTGTVLNALQLIVLEPFQ